MLYYMVDGTVYWSESGAFQLGEMGEVLHLEADKSLIIKNVSDTGFEATQMKTVFGKPKYIERPSRQITAILKESDGEFLNRCRAALAGLIIPVPEDGNSN